jgi:hypothetical protein
LKIQKQKLHKSGNKHYKKIREQNPGTKILKIREQKLQKSGNKHYKKSENKNPGTKFLKFGTKIT